jgi:hypothetical protein
MVVLAIFLVGWAICAELNHILQALQEMKEHKESLENFLPRLTEEDKEANREKEDSEFWMKDFGGGQKRSE